MINCKKDKTTESCTVHRVPCALFFFFFLLSPSFSLAQERDFYKNIIKESINMDFILDPTNINAETKKNDSTIVTIELDVNKNPLPVLGYNFKQNALYMNYKDSLPLEKKGRISPNLFVGYTQPDESESDAVVAANAVSAVLTPVASIVIPNPIAFFTYLMKIGVLSDEPFVHVGTKKEKKKRDALRIIREVYTTGEETGK